MTQKNGFSQIFSAFRFRNYRLFFAGQSVSLIGSWIQQVAMSWIVYRLTGSALYLGLVGFADQLPTFLLSPFAGVLADRWDRRRTLLAMQVLAMAQAFVLAALVYTDTVRIWMILVLEALLGTTRALEVPTRHAFIPQMVPDKNLLGTAIALNSTMFNLARLIGPAVAGFLIHYFGEGPCFAINGLSFAAVIVSLLAMSPAGCAEPGENGKHFLEEVREGFTYVFRSAVFRRLILTLSVSGMVGISCSVLMPVFARDILHGNSKTLGWMLSCFGGGAILGTLYMASRTGVHRHEHRIWIATAVLGIGMMAFAACRNPLLGFPLLVFMGAGMMVQMAGCNTILQTITDEDKRGRVMSYYTMAFLGAGTIGSVVAGWLAGRIGAQATVVVGGAVCLLNALYFLVRIPEFQRAIAPLYRQNDLHPEMTQEIPGLPRP